MPVQKSHYEACLAEYSNHMAAIALLKHHRPYLEMIPSLRRPDESLITIPLPIVRLRAGVTTAAEATRLPCDLAILMCDPEWKIKTSPEILIFIHRPHEDFSDFLGRWRQTQVWLDKDYESIRLVIRAESLSGTQCRDALEMKASLQRTRIPPKILN